MNVYSASEARGQWKQILDRAVAGETIHIERGGVHFVLLAKNTSPYVPEFRQEFTEVGFIEKKDLEKINIPSETVTLHSTPPQKKSVADATNLAAKAIEKKKTATEGLKFCKNGHILSSGGKCLQKGCKYA